mgnify:CR=1 FL=1
MIKGRKKLIKKLNQFGKDSKPCLFILDFEAKKGRVLSLKDCEKKGIFYAIKGRRNYLHEERKPVSFRFQKKAISAKKYKEGFDLVQEEINKGNTYLLNLTYPSKIETDFDLKDIFFRSNAKFKLLYKDKFVVFSPETFVKIIKGKIFSYPMKGTIDSSVEDAYNKLKTSTKEIAEHHTIVDLIRNDLNRVSKKVRLEKFRFIEEVKTHDATLLQVSSRISGQLPKDYQNNLGDLLFEMLPAGSVTGAPKKKTVEIIKEAEGYERGFYTGVFGLFDGTNLYSSVMIRFIENIKGKFYFKSGGGITTFSSAEEEYQELIDKVYVPIIGKHKNKKRKSKKSKTPSKKN